MVLPETCLSLCSGVAGLDIGLQRAFPGLRVVAYCERDSFAATVLLARMADEALESAPVWVGDLRDLDAAQFAGVDAVSAGYPCQPFSCAGKRKGEDDERHLWPEVLRIVRKCRPRYVFLENVSAHLLLGFDRVLCDLAGLGFNAEWAVVSAAEAGAPHLRKRLFVLAYSKDYHGGAGERGAEEGARAGRGRRRGPPGGCVDTLANAQGVLGQEEQREQPDGVGGSLGHPGSAREGADTSRSGSRNPVGEPGPALANADERGRKVERVAQPRGEQGEPGCEPGGRGQVRGQPDAPLADPCRQGRQGRQGPEARRGAFPPGPAGDWSSYPPHAQPAVRRAPHGSTVSPDGVDLAFRVDRLRCCGNAVVPAQAELAFRQLWERLI